MVRRDLAIVTLLVCLASFAVVDTASAQQPPSPRRIGVLLTASSPEEKSPQAFRQGLLDAGYAEGRDVVIEWRSANGDYDRLPRLAAELIQSKVDVLVVESTLAARAAKDATASTPIVMAIVSDPVASGFVTSLAHPGGNITGLSSMGIDITAKRLQLLKEAIPRLTRVEVVQNPDTPFHARVIEELKVAAPRMPIALNFVAVRTPGEIGPGFSAAGRAHAQALYIIPDALFLKNRTTLF